MFLIMGIVEHIFIYLSKICIFFSRKLFGQFFCSGLLIFDVRFMEMEIEVWPHYSPSHAHCMRAHFFNSSPGRPNILYFIGVLSIIQPFITVVQMYFFPDCHCTFHCLCYSPIRIIFVESNTSVFSLVRSEFCVTPRKLPYSRYFFKILYVYLQHFQDFFFHIFFFFFIQQTLMLWKG